MEYHNVLREPEVLRQQNYEEMSPRDRSEYLRKRDIIGEDTVDGDLKPPVPASPPATPLSPAAGRRDVEKTEAPLYVATIDAIEEARAHAAAELATLCQQEIGTDAWNDDFKKLVKIAANMGLYDAWARLRSEEKELKRLKRKQAIRIAGESDRGK